MEVVRNWNKPVNEWTQGTVMDYVVWVKDTYGEEEAKKLFAYAQGYRAIKDVMVDDPIDRQPTQIITSAGMVKMAQEILNNSMREVIEKHEHNLT
jgi:hypothetical protein